MSIRYLLLITPAMYQEPRRYFLCLVFAGLCLSCKMVVALEFQPGVGVGVEYTDNAALAPDNEVDDLIAIGYVGAILSEDEGPLTYDASTSFNNVGYTQDTFPDQHYFNLAGRADWEMIKDRFNWFLSNNFNQRTVNTLAANTPDNLQDTNAFSFGANLRTQISGRQSFSLSPSFSQYYYEVQVTNNKQYALAANWNYLLSRLNTVGINFSVREVNYTQVDRFGNTITDTIFTNLAFTLSGQRLRSDYSINLGATNVKRDSGEDATGFTGSIDWSQIVSSRSTFEMLVATDLTDTSRVSQSLTENPANGNPSDVQITTDVIRNSIFNLAYLRNDASLHSRIWWELRNLEYSDSPSDRVIRTYGISVDYPFTQLLSSGAYINYNRTRRLDIDRLDQYYIAGGNLKYNFARNLYSSFDIKYRTKESTLPSENYDEFSVFASLVYGFGDVQRPSRVGGY